jgi:hypothetical protein
MMLETTSKRGLGLTLKLTNSYFLGVCKRLFNLGPFASMENCCVQSIMLKAPWKRMNWENNSSGQLSANKCEQHYIVDIGSI